MIDFSFGVIQLRTIYFKKFSYENSRFYTVHITFQKPQSSKKMYPFSNWFNHPLQYKLFKNLLFLYMNDIYWRLLYTKPAPSSLECNCTVIKNLWYPSLSSLRIDDGGEFNSGQASISTIATPTPLRVGNGKGLNWGWVRSMNKKWGRSP